MKLTPHISLVFGGQREAAFRSYAENLNGRITFMLPWGSSPMASDPPAGGRRRSLTPLSPSARG